MNTLTMDAAVIRERRCCADSWIKKRAKVQNVIKSNRDYLMKSRPTFAKTLFTFLLTSVLTAHVFAEPPNLARLTTAVKAYHDSGDYQKEISLVLDSARSFIMQQADLNQKRAHPKRLAIVLDIDETSVSNYDKMVARGFVATHHALHQDIQKADSPAIKPMLALYREARQKGIAVFFVTGRPGYERQATEKNLKFAGFDHWDGLYFRPDDYKRPSIIPFKSQARAAIAKKGYTIVASIGDQCSDFLGGHALKGFKLPNPYYYLP